MFQRLVKIALFAATGLVFSIVQAQESVYERLLGREIKPTPVQEHRLSVTLTGQYDDIFRKTSRSEHIKIGRSGYGALIHWRPSENQSWEFNLSRSSEVYRINQTDSSFNFDSNTIRHRFRISHRRKLGTLPLRVSTFLQIYEDGHKTQWNYGLGIEGKIHDYRFALAGEQKSWLPFFQTLTSQSIYDVEIRFPTLAQIQQLRWSFAGSFVGFHFDSSIRTGRLVSSPNVDREYRFDPSAAVIGLTSSSKKLFNANWSATLSFLFNRISGDGVMRFRGRQYGNLHLERFQFSETRFSLHRRGGYQAGIAYQELSGKVNASVEAWPFDDSGVDFFGEKQSLAGDGKLSFLRGWLQSTIAFSQQFRFDLLAEYIHVKPNAQLRTWGSALVFGTGNLEEHTLYQSRDFVRIAISPKLALSRRFNLGIKLSQWLPLNGTSSHGDSTSKGGTLTEFVLNYSR